MSEPKPDVHEWARAHRARFEMEPLVELVEGRQIQVGLTVFLYARFPMQEKGGANRRALAAEIQTGLRDIVQSLKPGGDSPARMQIQPPRQAAVLSPQSGMEPEIAVEVRFFHAGDYTKEVTREEKDKLLAGIRSGLAAAGIKEGQWAP
jgi:hypothetical protein